MRNVIVLFCLLFMHADALAVPSRLAFKHLGVEEGFFQGNILSLYQDEHGVIWISSSNGLFRYNGRLPEDPVTGDARQGLLPRQQVKSILGERAGRIFLCQTTNIIVHDLRSGTFSPLFPDSLLAHQTISSACLRDGVLFAAAYRRVLRHEHDKSSVLALLPDIGEITAIAATSAGTLYLGTINRGLYRLDDSLTRVIPTGSKISALAEDSQGNLWVTTRSEGIFVIDPCGHIRQYKHRPDDPRSLVDNYVRCVLEDDDGLLWFGTMYGLDCHDPATGEFHHFGKSDEPLHSLRSLTVECIMKDAHGTIWLGSYYTGISYFNTRPTRFNSIPIISDNSTWTIIADITLDKRGNLWAATSDKGLYFYDRTTGRGHFYNTSNSRIAGNNIKCLQYDRARDALWIGAFMGGVTYYDIRRAAFTHVTIRDGDNVNPENTEIVHRVRLHGDSLYLATYAGVYVLDARSEQVVKLIDDTRVFDVLVDARANLYTVPLSNRFKMYGPGVEGRRRVLHDTTLARDGINALLEDSRGRIWIATGRNGLLRFDAGTRTTRHYHQGNCGIESDNTCALAETSSGKILVGSETGISVVDVDRMSAVNYNTYNGFPLVSMQNGCIYRSEAGELFMGGMNGIAWCRESDLDIQRSSPRVRFTRLAVNDQPVTPGDRTGILDVALPYVAEISLAHDQASVDISFCPDDWINFNPAAYHYKLAGNDDRWHDLSPGNTISYANLPSGHHELIVEEKQGEEAASRVVLRINVSPPYYASPPAYLVYILLIVGITALVIRYMDSRRLLVLERKEKERKERVTQWKLTFFTNISHEFRTPLTLILGQLDLVMQSLPPGPAYRRAIASVRRNAERLKLLIDELIDFRKQEQGFLKIKVRRQDIVPLLEETLASFRAYAEARGIALLLEAPPGETPLYIDAGQLQKVFYNLLSNAFKHTGQGGRVAVTVTPAPDRVAITVADTGSGIDKALFTTIFQRFYHHDENEADTGKGIGLAIAKAIVELHEGTIRVDSEVGAGATFTVELPTGRERLEGKEKIVFAEDDPPAPPPILPRHLPASDETSPPAPADGKRVLLVEDDEELRALLAGIFSRTYRVEQAANGEEGLLKAGQLQPDLVISDIMMPGLTGYELCERIKGNFETCHIPVILLTSLVSTEQNIEGLERGADDYVHKPFHLDLLLTRCSNLLKNREILQHKFRSGQFTSTKSITTNAMDEQFIAKILRLIEENMGSPSLNVAFLCREAILSRTALFAKIKAITGQTPNDLIAATRLCRAAALLEQQPALPVTEVAERCGFNSIQYFGKAFKARFNATPSAYREQAAQERNPSTSHN
ncbi:MAG: response regulator [Odoribacteraceae bacterium]|jgi:signal transduction histidine kinase/DNA-binding response OmpR family regulator/ligand-binding sensor domain-containing protein|nr:response regulator [Odoribacteraceae bacterium]